jgi:hypothetical protein
VVQTKREEIAEMKRAIKSGATYEEWAKNASVKVSKMPNIIRPKGPPPVVRLREALEKGSYDRKF